VPFWQINLPAELNAPWLNQVLCTFWSISSGYWSYSAAGWWCLGNFAAKVKQLAQELEDSGIEQQDRSALSGWEWRGVEIFNALW
jgi:hypothetical protein